MNRSKVGLPEQPRYFWTLRKTREFIKESFINWLPVDPFKIYEANNWLLFNCSQVRKVYGSPDPFGILENCIDAKTYRKRDTGEIITIYNEFATPERIRWTLAHEIGHIHLGHLTDFEDTSVIKGLPKEKYKILEREANIFASELLAPMAILKVIKAIKKEDIMRVCHISHQAAVNRENDIIWHGLKPIYKESTLELVNQFSIFLDAIYEVKRSYREIAATANHPEKDFFKLFN